MVATSESVTTVSPSAFTGMAKRSEASSMMPGTFTEKRPWFASRAPAGMSRLFWETLFTRVIGSMPKDSRRAGSITASSTLLADLEGLPP